MYNMDQSKKNSVGDNSRIYENRLYFGCLLTYFEKVDCSLTMQLAFFEMAVANLSSPRDDCHRSRP